MDIECFARDLEAKGKARATVARRLCTVAGLFRYAEEEGLIDHSPAVHVRRPRLDYESHAVGLDRNELGAFLVAAGLGSACEHALASLLALNGCASPRPWMPTSNRSASSGATAPKPSGSVGLHLGPAPNKPSRPPPSRLDAPGSRNSAIGPRTRRRRTVVLCAVRRRVIEARDRAPQRFTVQMPMPTSGGTLFARTR